MSDYEKKDVPLAIILTFAAGLSTVIGASFSFCIKPHQVQILPISLAFSAGVMIYVSMIEIMAEASEAFQHDLESKHPDSYELLSHIYLSLVFFGGIAIGYGLDAIVHCLGYKHELMQGKDIAAAQGIDCGVGVHIHAHINILPVLLFVSILTDII